MSWPTSGEDAAAPRMPSAGFRHRNGSRRSPCGLMASRQCLNCHEIDPAGQFRVERRPAGVPAFTFASIPWAEPSPPPLRDLAADRANLGCLAPKGGATGKAPRFDLSDDDRAALRAYVGALKSDAAPSTSQASRIELAAMNFARCHQNEGAGGRSLADLLGGGDEAKYRSPPTLTGAGDHVRPGRLARWISAGARDEALRPWTGARMPGFGLRGSHVAEDLGLRDGAAGPTPQGGPTAPAIRKPEIRPDQVQLGRFLVGSKALGCINCHSFRGKYLAGQPDPTTRGPDLTRMGEHLRRNTSAAGSWTPARIRPETKMPKSLLADGSIPSPALSTLPPDAPMTALWTYLNQGPNALPPAEEPSILPAPTADRPVVQRGDTTTDDKLRVAKGLSLGFPDGTLLFDADLLAPVAVWHGGFVKGNSQAYFGMGWLQDGGKTTPLPTRKEAISFRLTPEGPWQSSPLPLESDLNDGSRFEGYRIGKSAVRLRYRLLAGPHKVSVIEDVRVESRPSWQGYARRLRFSGLPEGARVSLLTPDGESFEPRTHDGKAEAGNVDAKAAPVLTFRNGPENRALRVAAAPGSTWEGIPADGRGRGPAPAHLAGHP